MTVRIPVDDIGAFVAPPSLLLAGAETGPLAGTTLAVKDLFDVAGTVSGAGNPTFAAGRAPATSDSVAVAALVDAGASVVGKTITDELAYSLAGTNVHYGTPRNVAAPGRVPGGSSAGSAAAVAARLVDLALGTDTGGSIRIPASYCGIYGWRPTHGAVSADGVVALAPSFDTIGLLANDAALLQIAADVVLPAAGTDVPVTRLRIITATLDGLPDDIVAGLHRIAAGLSADGPVDLGIDLDAAAAAFRTLQGAEAWQEHGEWIERVQPAFGPGIEARFRAAAAVTAEAVAAARPVRAGVTEAIRAATAGGTVLLMPAAAGVAPLIGTDAAGNERQRSLNLRLTCLAGLSGAPVVVAPLLRSEGLPLGVAFVGAPGTDRALLAWLAATFFGQPTVA
ncbi:MAG: Amidase [Ilumatobacteraceae bacterium]|nr:Amidase [Ilumatobacteraceae bacterium]